MTYHKRPYEEGDFFKIRDFLTASRAYSDANWLIDRWNFCRFFAQPMLNTTGSWPATVGIWEDGDGRIAAVVNSEGEGKGEAFFQLGDFAPPAHLLQEMFDHAEQMLAAKLDGMHPVSLRVASSRVDILSEQLALRGYERTSSREAGSHLALSHRRPVELPEGYRLADGSATTPESWGLAHGRTFRNINGSDIKGLEERIQACAVMRTSPDYSADRDLVILDSCGDIAAFANVWHDEINQLGILEPVGTVPLHRRKGLGKALINEAANRLIDLGATMLLVGSEQQFYLDCGFELDDTYDEIWQKISPS